jgi:hypothetical protein
MNLALGFVNSIGEFVGLYRPKKRTKQIVGLATRPHLTNPAIIEGSLEVKLRTIWTDEKQRWKGSERREE